ncbi:hypothetical protein BLNAU_14579 [Blattamonas nauphoetae]|uniref:Uncharacterized protein n=1 Tax=Blattamonas nauphoetae TaxID=2049346 RepID=A0ABQ9XES1_9EUKA|nr:hypothetical protein BLNAU_14579 [Blattamonas nauphoetae]
MDCSPFLNWSEDPDETVEEKAVVFRSLVATLKLQPALEVSLEAKAVRFLESVCPDDEESADAFLTSLGQTPGESSTDFVQSIVVLLSSASQVIISTSMKMLDSLIGWCSTNQKLAPVEADLIPQMVINLNPQSLSFSEAVDVSIQLLNIINHSLWLATPDGLEVLEIEDDDEQQAVHKTVLKQVLSHSEKYIWHLCVNRLSIIDIDQSTNFLKLLAGLLRISPSYQSTMNFVLHMPVFLTITSCLTFFKDDFHIRSFLYRMMDLQREWDSTRGEVRRWWKTVSRMLRMEGIEDVLEERRLNDKNESSGRLIVAYSIQWNNLQGMNLPWRG